MLNILKRFASFFANSRAIVAPVTVKNVAPRVVLRRYEIAVNKHGRTVYRTVHTINGRFCDRATYFAASSAMRDAYGLMTLTEHTAWGKWRHTAYAAA